jgi:hypothetical protein
VAEGEVRCNAGVTQVGQQREACFKGREGHGCLALAALQVRGEVVVAEGEVRCSKVVI